MSARAPLSALSGYPYRAELQTRWSDNDIYGHVNNVTYYSYFDTVINRMLIERGLLDIRAGSVIGLVVETGCRYVRPMAFPGIVYTGVGVRTLGRTSVTYQVGLGQGTDEAADAEGHFTHVYVDRESRTPVEITPDMRASLEGLLLEREG